MADFVEKSVTKTAVRALATPIADVSSFDTIVQSVITGNPFGCVAWTEGGVAHQPVEKSKESYVAKVVYQDTLAKTVGNESGKYTTIAGFNAGAAAILADAALTAAHGGTPVRDPANETLLVHPEVPRPERGDLYGHLQPGECEPHLVLGRRNPHEGGDLGRFGGGLSLR